MIPRGGDAAADVRRPRAVHADRLPGVVLARRSRLLVRLHCDRARVFRTRTICRQYRDGCSATFCRTTCCWRYRSSRLWARCSSGAVSPKTCSTRWASSSARCAAASGYSVIIVGFILGAITGTVAGQVIAMALISLPVMMRYGYNMRYATGVLGRLGNHHAAGAALAGADRAGRPARQVGRRHVSRRVGPVGPADRASSRSIPLHSRVVKPSWVPAAPREHTHRNRLGIMEEMPARHHSVGGADLRRSRDDDARPCDADRGGRDGCYRRDRPCRDASPRTEPLRPARFRCLASSPAAIGTAARCDGCRPAAVQSWPSRSRISRWLGSASRPRASPICAG